jgi:surface antigen
MRRILRALLPLLPLLLAACGSSRGPGAGAYVGDPVALDCVPFARALSGVQLRGPAADWWPAAEGVYARTRAPEPGSVLVFPRSDRLPQGHLAVVSRVLSERRITVSQANWEHGRVTADQPVLDVSPDNSWTSVRVWWPPSRQLGAAAYATNGFIRAARRTTPDEIAEATPRALRIALAR